jgi:hypothetical protein
MELGMKASANLVENHAGSNGWPLTPPSFLRPTNLYLITLHDVTSLRDDLARGNVPLDLEAKLNKLAGDDLGHRFIEQNCRTMLALFQAAQAGSFLEASPAQCERLLGVLAYVRKDDDAIPDYQTDGFLDDQQEVRALANELGPLLQAFKAWRLRHQVPGMWLTHTPRVGRTARPRPNLCPELGLQALS